MLITNNIQVYVKTTETCNLNCQHCFTSGSSGPKIYFNPQKVSQFIKDVVIGKQLTSLRVVYHGGEPMLAPLNDLYDLYHKTKDLLPDVSYGIQTNLVYKITDEKLKFFNDVFLGHGVGTSWDPNIRFGSVNPAKADEQLQLWESNVRLLLQHGHQLTLMVCLTSYVLENYQPYEIVNYAIDLGFQHILFERVTSDGNLTEHLELLPDNKKLDAWMLAMYQQTVELKLHLKINNIFLDEIVSTFNQRVHKGNRCRNCEQKILTINATGTVSGCPNSAQRTHWGHIDHGVQAVLASPLRLQAMCSERMRNPVCGTCPVRDLCNGDCYKLPWQGEYCAAPKSLLGQLKFASPKTLDELAPV
jgi:radical SAM protein with 4Fe4S-binding SPASM domain